MQYARPLWRKTVTGRGTLRVMIHAALVYLLLTAAGPAWGQAHLDSAVVQEALARTDALAEDGDYNSIAAILRPLALDGAVPAAVRLADLFYDKIDIDRAVPDQAQRRMILDVAIAYYESRIRFEGPDYLTERRRLARLLLLRADGEADIGAAIDHFRGLIALGSGAAAYDLGRAYMRGFGVLANGREAERFLQIAIDMGDIYAAPAAHLLGNSYQFGDGRTADPYKAEYYLSLAVQGGNIDAAASLAHLYDTNLPDQQLALAAIETEIRLTEAAFQADPRGTEARRLADIYLRSRVWPQDIDQAIYWLTTAAGLDDPLAAYRLFQIYGEPSFGHLDRDTAFAYARQAVEAEYWKAMPSIAYHYFKQACEDPAAASTVLDWLQRAAEAQHALSMHVMALAYEGQWPCLTQDRATAVQWHLRAARAGWGASGEVLRQGRRYLAAATDAAMLGAALDLIGIARDRGNVAAEVELATYQTTNPASDAEFARAMDTLRRLATDKGNVRAMLRLANVLLYSPEAAERSEAIAWLTRAAGYGRVDAMQTLGQLYFEGTVIPRDLEKAEAALSRAFLDGDIASGLYLGDIYVSDYGGAQDLARAREIYENLVDIGSAEAMLRLSEIYRFGIGVDVQPERADALLARAAESGNESAVLLLDMYRMSVEPPTGSLVPAETGPARLPDEGVPDTAEPAPPMETVPPLLPSLPDDGSQVVGLDSSLPEYFCSALEVPENYGEEFAPLRTLSYGSHGVMFRSETDFDKQVRYAMTDVFDMYRLIQALNYRGTNLVIALIPPRGVALNAFLDPENSVHADFDVQKMAELFNRNLRLLQDAGAIAPDLLELATYSPGDESLYFYFDDPHWSAHGARSSAAAIGALIREHPDYAQLSPQTIEVRSLGETQFFGSYGDVIQNVCGIRPISRSYEYFDTVPVAQDGADALLFDEPADAGQDLLLETHADYAVLVGTSFSMADDAHQVAGVDPNFPGLLEASIGALVDNQAATGGGFDTAFQAYVRSVRFRDEPPPFLIWEFLAYHEIRDQYFFRTAIPAIYGECTEAEALAVGTVPLSIETTTVIPAQDALRIPVDGTFLFMDIDDLSLVDFVVEVEDASGYVDRVRVNRSTRVLNDGRFFLSLFDLGAPVVEIRLKHQGDYRGHVDALVCREPVQAMPLN